MLPIQFCFVQNGAETSGRGQLAAAGIKSKDGEEGTIVWVLTCVGKVQLASSKSLRCSRIESEDCWIFGSLSFRSCALIFEELQGSRFMVGLANHVDR